MKKLSLILIVVPFILFSCKDALEELSTIGTFTSTITGDVSKEFNGNAVFVHNITTNSIPNGSLLSLGLTMTSNQSEVIAFTLSNSLNSGIEVGTYDFDIIGNSDIIFGGVYTNEQGTYTMYSQSLENQITISSVGNTRVKGTFEVNLTNLVTQKNVKIVGTFDALGTTETD